MSTETKSTETKRQQLDGIIRYVESLENPGDAEFLKEIRCLLHDASVIADYQADKNPSAVMPGCTTTVGNIAILLRAFRA